MNGDREPVGEVRDQGEKSHAFAFGRSGIESAAMAASPKTLRNDRFRPSRLGLERL
jgi:hypothetical protein